MTLSRLFIAVVLIIFFGSLVYLIATRPSGQDSTGQAPPHAIEQNPQAPSPGPPAGPSTGTDGGTDGGTGGASPQTGPQSTPR